MTAYVLGLQILVPLAALLWLTFRPAGCRLCFALQAAGTGALLLALALVTQWGVVPWWLPRLYGGWWVSITLLQALRGKPWGSRLLPSGFLQGAQAAVSLALVGAGLWYGAAAIRGRTPPPAAVVDIANPFGPGHYLVASGGGHETVNAHLRTLDPEVTRYRAWRGQSYALDFVALNAWGMRAAGLRPAGPEAYAIFGARLHAPCAGDVLATENNMPDFEVPEQDTVNRLGNHVLLRCGDAVILLAHMRRGSLTVSPGQRVSRGHPLGQVGNSGASGEPHLHVHAQRPADAGDSAISGDPLALTINGRFLVRNDRIDGHDW